MAREVRTDDYTSKLLKLIPSEIIATYLILQGMVPEDQIKYGSIVIVIVLTILAPFYFKKVQGVKNKPQLVITSVSFLVWVFSLGGPVKVWWPDYGQWMGSMALILWTMSVPVLIDEINSKKVISDDSNVKNNLLTMNGIKEINAKEKESSTYINKA